MAMAPLIRFFVFISRVNSYPYVSAIELLDELYGNEKEIQRLIKVMRDATLEDIFSADELKDAQKLKATWLETTIFENRNGKIYPKKIPASHNSPRCIK